MYNKTTFSSVYTVRNNIYSDLVKKCTERDFKVRIDCSGFCRLNSSNARAHQVDRIRRCRITERSLSRKQSRIFKYVTTDLWSPMRAIPDLATQGIACGTGLTPSLKEVDQAQYKLHSDAASPRKVTGDRRKRMPHAVGLTNIPEGFWS